MKIRVELVDDHRIFREGLRSLLEKQEDIAIVGEAANGRAALKQLQRGEADVVVMDLSMPELNGIEAARQILARFKRTKLLILSMHSDRRFISEALRVGVSGYLLKENAFDELVRAIREVMAGRTCLSEAVAHVVMDDYKKILKEGAGHSLSLLSAREREVLQLLAEGVHTKEIAHRLGVSVKTVETYRSQLMAKLQLHSIAALTKYAVREGITPL